MEEREERERAESRKQQIDAHKEVYTYIILDCRVPQQNSRRATKHFVGLEG